MVWAAVCVVFGLLITATGGLFTLGFFMPKWGGGSEPVGTLILGLFLTALGVGLIFYAGTLA